MSSIGLTLFGTTEITQGGRPTASLPTQKALALLIYLAVERGREHRREELTGLLWPGMPERSARHNLRQVLYFLRQAFPEVAPDDGSSSAEDIPLLTANRSTIQLHPHAAVQIDVADFEAHLTRTQGHAHLDIYTCPRCRADLEAAVALYGGDFLADFYLDDSNIYEAWSQARRDGYRRQALDALETLTASHMRAGEYAGAQQYAEQQLAIDNLRESAYRQLMEVLALNGRRQEALAQYETLRRVLAEELGMTPSARTTALYEQIQAGEVRFDAPPAQGVHGYDLREELGKGAYGAVYAAVQPHIGRQVAVKVIRDKYADDPEFILRFEAEAQMVARLEHPNIVPLYDYWRDPSGAYLVMRYLSGGSLLTSLDEGPWDLEATTKLVDQVASALSLAHHQGVVHRDIKPANILLDGAGNAYLTDFGIAKDLGGDAQMTADGALMGTPDYISPEQIKNEAIGPQSDIYSLGAVIYEMLIGEKPFPDASLTNLFFRHLNEPVPMATASRPDLPPAVDEVIQRATAKEPSKRFQDALELSAALRRAASGAGVAFDSEFVMLPPGAATANPYKGLRAFQEADAADFFGRDALVAQLVARLAPEQSNGRSPAYLSGDRFLAVVGPSGSGKSSVVKAGLIPALREGALPGSDKWYIAEMVPGTHPLEELELALLPIAVDPPAGLVEPMQRDVRGLLRTLRRILPGREQGQLLLIIDQFEELFTLVEDEERRDFFIESLLTALNAPNSPLRVLVTLRADFYDRPLQVQSLGQLVKQGTEIVLPMTAEELTWAVREPAHRSGVRLESGLAAAIVADVGDQPGALPLMQYALTELFEQRENGRLTLDAYRQIGGVSGALARRAEEIYQGLDEAGQEAARQLFLRLVTLGEGVEDTRRRVLRAELEAIEQLAAGGEQLAVDGDPAANMNPESDIIDVFGRARLLTFDRDPQTRAATVEVAHEALLREWPRLRHWLDESRDDVRLERLLATAVAEWNAAGQGAGYLLRGSRLDQFENWAAETDLSLTPGEVIFLEESLAARRLRQAEEDKRRQRELETAQQLAEAERARAEEQEAAAAGLRRRAMILAGALAVAALLALAAVFFANQSADNASAAEQSALAAQESADLAATSEALAIANEQQALANEQRAEENAALAATREAEAISEAEFRAAAEADAGAQRDVALQREREALESFSLSLAANARQALEADDQSLAMLLALAANSIDDPPLDAWRTLLDVAYAPGAIREYDVGSPVNSIAAGPDGTTMLTGSDDGLVRVWDIESGELLHTLDDHQDAVAQVAFSPDGTLALTGGGEGSLLLWDTATWEVVRELEGHNNWIGGIAFLPDGRALSGEDPGRIPGDLILWDLETGEIVNRFGNLEEQVEGVRGIAVTPDGRTALVGYGHDSEFDTSAAAIWDIENGQVLHFLAGPEGIGESINSVTLTTDGLRGIGASDNRNVYSWDIETGALLNTLSGHNGLVTAVGVSPDGLTALSGALDGGLVQWDITAGRAAQRFQDHHDGISTIIYLDEDRALSSSWDGTVRLWDLGGRWIIDRWRDPSMPANYIFDGHWISPDGNLVLGIGRNTTTNEDFILTLWDYETGMPLRRLEPVDGYVGAAAFTPDSRQVLTGNRDGTLTLWDVATGQALREYEVTGWGAGEQVHLVDISEDARNAISSAGFEELLYWDLESGEILQRMIGHIVSFPPGDGRLLPGDRQAVTGGGDGTVIFWDLETGEQIRRLTGLEGGEGGHLIAEGVSTSTRSVNRAIPTFDGRFMLTAGDDATLLLWDLNNGVSMRRFRGHAERVLSAAMTADGRLALSGAPRDDMILWDVSSGQPIRRYQFPELAGRNFFPIIQIHPDGQTAVTDYVDNTLVKWQLAEPQPSELLDWIAANRALRELTCLERETYRIEPLCIDGQPQETTADMLATARRTTADLDTTPAPLEDTPADAEPLPMTPPLREPKTAVLGENRGELERGNFDVWTYDGRAGEIISLRMVADRPLVDRTIPLEERYAAGVLDTVLTIDLPDSSLLNYTDDQTTVDLQHLSDANFIALRLPQDGPYRIEARSALDDQAGPYSLIIEQLPEVWHADLYEEYAGHYLEGPWQWNEYLFIHDGRFFVTYPDYGGSWLEATPLSETEFAGGGADIIRMQRDENGAISGFEVLYGYEHPEVGGHWYTATRVGDLPPEFVESLEEGSP